MQNALRFVIKNRSFSSLKNNFKIRIKSYLSQRKNLYFSSKILGLFAFTFCRYFHQNLQVLPSESVAGNTLRFRGKKQYIFQTKFFPLEFEGISYNSVLPLTSGPEKFSKIEAENVDYFDFPGEIFEIFL